MSCTALVLWWSKGGNTKKVAQVIHSTLCDQGVDSELCEISEDLDIDVFDRNLVFCGAPVYGNLAPEPVMAFLKKLRRRAAGLPSAPERPGRFAVLFDTYAGGHTGLGEAVPLLKFMGQVFEHEGFRVVGEWPVVGGYPEAGPDYNSAGRLGDVRTRPHQADLDQIAGQVSGLLTQLQHKLGIEALLTPPESSRVCE